jgi:uncharacterized PurR-regulated membrane protein YhhQ (DUF165 family)
MIWLLGYITTIVAANIITAGTAPLMAGPFIIPWGTFLIGGTLVLRDAVQIRFGRRVSYIAIAVALVASAVSSHALGDTLAITAASAVAFAFSESVETEIFSRFRALLAVRIFWSGTVSSLIDSVLFIVLGLSPLTTGIVPWPFIPMAILGQYIVKTAMVSIGSGVSLRVNPMRVAIA